MRLIERDKGIGFGSEGADIPGAVLITGSLMLGVYTIVKPAAEDGWGATRRWSSPPSRCCCWWPSSSASPRRATR